MFSWGENTDGRLGLDDKVAVLQGLTLNADEMISNHAGLVDAQAAYGQSPGDDEREDDPDELGISPAARRWY